MYVKFVEFIQKHFFKDSVGIYDEVNKKLLTEYKKNNKLDGEIRFLAANQDLKIKGIGTMLLSELEKREKGKEIYLFTDDQCTYQFYEHRGFDKIGEEDIVLELNGKVPLKCLLYKKNYNSNYYLFNGGFIKKENYYKFMWTVSALLLLGFTIGLGVDYYKYNPITTSAPFYVDIIIKTIEFILPSIIIFLIGIFF